MTINTEPTNGDGLDAPHDQPAKLTNKTNRILGAIRTFIKDATSGFSIDLGIGLDSIMLLILAAILLIQGVTQWMR